MRDDQEFFATLDMANGMRRRDGEAIIRRKHWRHLTAIVQRIVLESQSAEGDRGDAAPMAIQSLGEPASFAAEGAK